MRKLLFIDHAFHKRTRSADFFVDVLQEKFDVDLYYLSPEERPDVGVLAAADKVDIVVLWQMDFLAPVFLAMGKPVIVLPMFDGSGGMPEIHWLFAHKARFLNFCLALNERIRMAGCKTMLLRYFPEAVKEEKLPRFDRLDAFFWQRRPDHGVHFDLVDHLIGHEIDSLHVHNAADIPGNFTPILRSDAKYQYSQSNWFKEKSDYTKRLDLSNVFVAPRVAEGIGMALLEAMAHGKLVLAHDAPTNSEYISNGCNGILFNKDQASPVMFRDQAAQIARMAWRTVVEGRKKWLGSRPAILEWIDNAAGGSTIEMDHEDFFRNLWYSYYSSLEEYTSFLTANLKLLSQLTELPFAKLLDAIGEAQSDAMLDHMAGRDCTLDENGVLDLTREDDRFIGSGWSNAEPELRWAVGRRSELYFSGIETATGRVKVSFTASSLRTLGKWVKCAIMLNEELVFDGRVTPSWSSYRFSFDAGLLRPENHLVLLFDKAGSLPTDGRMLSICFKEFTFSADGSRAYG